MNSIKFHLSGVGLLIAFCVLALIDGVVDYVVGHESKRHEVSRDDWRLS